MGSKRKRITKKDKFRFVSLDIIGRNLNPHKITKILGIEPDSIGKKNTPILPLGGKRSRVGHWAVEGRPKGARLETQLKSIIRKIAPIKNRLKRALKDRSVEWAYLNIGVEPSKEAAIANYYFDAEILREFTELGVDIDLSIWIPGVFDEIADEVEKEMKS